ncbi:hypothetical protein TPHA_0B02200 [Tetrapisispora phaffii CBS 4417]|uniref:Cytochrome c oxidase subunit 8, mitochondrial n=1 Tax=Tetrapisispora phaffii (strain ATCC 24235 / CBS 4417 / NBRC 1672 / NRRL Y-8282 / UCD 70-5) TaxID=1071381 RepID=G8BPG1_TETPH|nr:hypothetical protein TPHA_0B02200 [Tetrapisispora phaffii CBS 4417]CCE61892.1 hypothetical protein TPHA_0B02200 [Tetrapisispora phaffii CBS 4417]
MINQLVRLNGRRYFSQSLKSNVHFKDGVYTNLPFKVKDRKTPYALTHFAFFGLGFAVPFLITYAQLKKSGTI